ncbi:fungal specific transcription factor domain-containing protein [Aspergillus mulundensis]|uniref:Xylanolytic transcriptional activator regulatory domain-containing protein n=1 Tax=Aspergillus mulundensis TaxID=1810919 RepID=A0A3D8T452_9EURO|nr:hypothetical protein DSM5745_00658 [Aspergillus mulundensis]RDW93336.1 hypothetical protein DSM5745_00658 [Aspergillus mulundensis]
MDQSKSIPPTHVQLSIIDTCQQNAYGPADPFRDTLDAESLPRYYILAMFALAAPSVWGLYFDRVEDALEAAVEAAKESWSLILASHGPEGIDNPTIKLVQSLIALGLINYRAGWMRSAFAMTTAAVKVARALRLTVEPCSSLTFKEQEEHRRIFWHTYMQDSVFVCARSRPRPAFDNEECAVQVPIPEEVFRAEEWQSMCTATDLIKWDFQTDGDLPPLSVVFYLVTILARCSKYIYGGDDGDGDDDSKSPRKQQEQQPPWSSNSAFAKMNSDLAAAKSSIDPSALLTAIKTFRNGVGISRETSRFVILNTLFFDVCQCLVNHPFTVQQRSRQFGQRKLSIDLTTRVLFEDANPHARQMVEIVDQIHERGDLHRTSMPFPFWVALAGGILSIAFHVEAQKGHVHAETSGEAPDSCQYFVRAVNLLERLALDFPAAANMAIRLRDFHAYHSQVFAASLNPTSLSESDEGELDPATEQALWTLIDHELVGAPIPPPVPRLSDTSTCPSMDLGSEHSF